MASKHFLDKKRCIVISCAVIICCICILVFYRRIGRKPNIVLITIDALRADHLGCYGYKRNTSPNIDDLARQGATFLNCFSTGPATIFSTGGLLTGKYLLAERYESSWNNILDNKFTTIAEYLKGSGYYTLAFIANEVLRNGRGFEQGFDYFICKEKQAEQLTNDVLSSLNKLPNNKPFFIWIHYMDTHTPFIFREEYFRKLEGDKLYQKEVKILELRPSNRNYPVSGGYLPPEAYHEGKFSLNYYIACYDSAISYVDYWIGNLLKNLKSDTVIILTADHGEYLGEHNIYFAHGEAIYDEALHIPLIIKDNRFFKSGKKIPAAVSAVDIVPTILNTVNSGWYLNNKNRFDGLDFKRSTLNKNGRRKYIYSYFPWAWSIRDVDKNIKYIYFKYNREEMYFLPDEYNDILENDSSEIRSIKKELKEKLFLWMQNYPIRSDTNAVESNLDENVKNKLRSLGYLQ